MASLVDLPLDDALIVILERELSKIITDAENYEKLFLSLLTIVMEVCDAVSKDTSVQGTRYNIKKLENWIREHYVVFRADLPINVKQDYLKKIAFPVREPK